MTDTLKAAPPVLLRLGIWLAMIGVTGITGIFVDPSDQNLLVKIGQALNGSGPSLIETCLHSIFSAPLTVWEGLLECFRGLPLGLLILLLYPGTIALLIVHFVFSFKFRKEKPGTCSASPTFQSLP